AHPSRSGSGGCIPPRGAAAVQRRAVRRTGGTESRQGRAGMVARQLRMEGGLMYAVERTLTIGIVIGVLLLVFCLGGATGAANAPKPEQQTYGQAKQQCQVTERKPWDAA